MGDRLSLRSFVTSRFGVLAVAAWVLWYVGVLGIKAWFRSLKDPSVYTGTCYKPNGYAVQCSLEQWMEWEAAPYVGIYIFVGGLLVAAFTGFMFLRYLARLKASSSGGTTSAA